MMEDRPSTGIDYAMGIDPCDRGEGLEDFGLMLPDYDHPKELAMRNGMNRVRSKLERGPSVTVGYIGGSITLQEGWRPRTTAWLRSRFPLTRILEVNAAVNGTSAEFGAVRIDQHVLVERPDLIFIEFVVNGASVQGIEGMVRKIWRTDPGTDICFVYTLNSEQVPSYRPGAEPSFPSSLKAFESVAEHYGIPSIFLGYVIGELYAQHKLVPKGEVAMNDSGIVSFTKDGVHPLPTGDQLYAGAVARSLVKMFHAKEQQPSPRDWKEPLDRNDWELATMRDAADFNTDLEVLDTGEADFSERFPYKGGNIPLIRSTFPTLVHLSEPGDSLSVQFKGSRIGIADAGGPFSGQLGVDVEGQRVMTLNRFTKYSANPRHQVVFLPELPDQEHTVRFTLLPDVADKQSMLLNRDDYDKNPAAYQKNEVYLGKILIVGDFVGK